MKGLKQILLLLALFALGPKAQAQSIIYGTVRDVDTQLVIGQMVEVYTDSMGTPFPFQATVYTGVNGMYSVTLPTNVPQGVVFVVKTMNCTTPIANSFLYPFNTIACDFTICATHRYISGHVYMGNNAAPAGIAVANLIQRHLDTFTNQYITQRIDSLVVDTAGFFNFQLPPDTADEYIISAGLLPADTANYTHYMPAYYNGGLKWNDATIISSAGAEADVILPMVNGMQGQGYISGKVVDANGDSLYRRLLILTTDNDMPLGFRYSNIDGTFSFGGLNYGSYKLFGDALGKQNPPLIFSIATTTSSYSTIVFRELDDIFYGSLWPLSVNTAANEPGISVYPNPVVDQLNITGLNASNGAKRVSLLTISGQEVYHSELAAVSSISIPMQNMVAGLYVLRVETKAGVFIYKIAR